MGYVLWIHGSETSLCSLPGTRTLARTRPFHPHRQKKESTIEPSAWETWSTHKMLLKCRPRASTQSCQNPHEGCRAPPQLQARCSALMHICRDRCPWIAPAAEKQGPYDPFLNQTLCTLRTYLELCKADKPIQQLPQETVRQSRKCTFGINYPKNVIKRPKSPLGWQYQWAKGHAERSAAQIIMKTRGTTEHSALES